MREASRQIVEDPAYRQTLIARANTGELAPAVETMLWHYAYGKPSDRIELTGKDGKPLIPATAEDALAALAALGVKEKPAAAG